MILTPPFFCLKIALVRPPILILEDTIRILCENLDPARDHSSTLMAFVLIFKKARAHAIFVHLNIVVRIVKTKIMEQTIALGFVLYEDAKNQIKSHQILRDNDILKIICYCF